MSATSYNCPHCAAQLSHNVQTQNWDCTFCGSSFTLETLTDREIGGRSRQYKGMKAYNCPSCGGQVISGQNTTATFCTFCHAHTVIESRLDGQRSPDSIIPFQITKEDALDKIRSYCQFMPLLPPDIRHQMELGEITGLYVPYWLFSGNAEVTVTGKYEKTEARHSSDSTYNYYKKNTYSANRKGTLSYQDISADGSVRLDNTLMDNLEPYDYTKLTEFAPQYLTGYFAETYDVDAVASWERFRPLVENAANARCSALIHDISGLVNKSVQIHFPDHKARYALLPVWILMGRYRGKTYAIAVNGQTGKLSVDLPWSFQRAAAWFAGLTALLTAMIYMVVI